GFSRVVLRFPPTNRPPGIPRHHRLQPCGASVSTYESAPWNSPTPPASAVWCFGFHLLIGPLEFPDTTRLKPVVSVNLRSSIRRWKLKNHTAEAGGVGEPPKLDS